MSGGDSNYMRRNADDDDLGWLGNFDDTPAYDYGNLFDYDYGVIVPPPDMGVDIFDPGNFQPPPSYDVPPGSIFEGMIPGVLAPPSQAELDAVQSVIDPSLWEQVKGLGSNALKFLKDNPWAAKLLTVGGGALLGSLDKAPPSGGGVAKRYVGPSKQLTRTVEQGKYGPIAKFAAAGGIMHAYRNGGQVRPFPMQDGGFVYTKRAVDGAGGPRGLASLVPNARMIGGPPDPTGRKDLTPAYIQGPNGRTPARVSRGEAYAPPDGQTRQHYALMKQLERNA